MKQDHSYYLTLFKIEGHSTYRASLKANKKGFEQESANWPGKPTDVRQYRIDRVTGEISPI